MKVRSGTYTGDGVNNRIILTPGIEADFIIIKGSEFTRGPQIWLRNMGEDNTLNVLLGGGFYAGGIKEVLNGSIRIGSDVLVNNSGEAYAWLALQEHNVVLFTCEGDGIDNRIIDLDVSPSAVFIFSDDGGNGRAEWASTLHPPEEGDPELENNRSQAFGSASIINRIQELNDCGLELGNSVQVNQAGVTYYGMVFKETEGVFALTSYTGTAPAPQSISVGFQPLVVFVHQTQVTSFTQPMLMRLPDSSGTTTSWRMDDFGGGLGTAAGITSINVDGFTVGTHEWVNANGNLVIAFAIADGELDELELTEGCVEPEPPVEEEIPCIGLDILAVPDCRSVASASRPVFVCRY